LGRLEVGSWKSTWSRRVSARKDELSKARKVVVENGRCCGGSLSFPGVSSIDKAEYNDNGGVSNARF
jgi:hypothetical protein